MNETLPEWVMTGGLDPHERVAVVAEMAAEAKCDLSRPGRLAA